MHLELRGEVRVGAVSMSLVFEAGRLGGLASRSGD